MNVIDRMVAAVNPQRALKRQQSREMLKIMNYGYSEGGASRRKPAFKHWKSDSKSPISDIDKNLKTLRDRSRSLYYNSPIAASAINRNIIHVIGAGLRVAPKINYKRLGISKEEAAEMEREIKFQFDLWAKSKDCDITGQNNFYELQQITMMTWLIGGEAFVIPQYRESGMYGLTLKTVEGDLVSNPNSFDASINMTAKNPDNGNRIYNGIEIDADGRVVAYWFASNYTDIELAGRTWKRVEAKGEQTGNPNVLHVFNAVRPTQYRGVPYLAPVIECIKQLTRYTEAEIMAAVINGLFSVFITTEDGRQPMFMGNDESEDDTDVSLELGNGNIGFLEPGEKVEVVDAKRPNISFDGFTAAFAKYIGGALNIPSELLLLQFTASYSASRGALLEAYSYFTMNRSWFANDYCQPIYELWLNEAVSKRILKMPGYFESPTLRAVYTNASWVGPAAGQLDPVKEVQAAQLKMDAGISTGEIEALQINGTNFEDNLEQLANEKLIKQELGLEGGSNGTD